MLKPSPCVCAAHTARLSHRDADFLHRLSDPDLWYEETDENGDRWMVNVDTDKRKMLRPPTAPEPATETATAPAAEGEPWPAGRRLHSPLTRHRARPCLLQT